MEAPAARILVVDDQADVREVLAELLAAEGFDVQTAEGGLAALLRIGCLRPDCLVLDMKLQDINGLEVLRTLRRDPQFRSLPVLFISAVFRDESWLQQELGSEPLHYLPKPIVQEDLVRVIRALLAAGPAKTPSGS
jgi:CheY-like chemotaxis protein